MEFSTVCESLDLNDEQSEKLKNHHINKVPNAFYKIHNKVSDEFNKNEKLAIATVSTMRISQFPLTVQETAKAFNVEKSIILEGIEDINELIDREIETDTFEEKRMLVVNNLSYSNEVQRGFNELLELYENKLEEKNNKFSDETVILACIWQASKLSDIELDSMFIKPLTNMFANVEYKNISDCYLELFVDNGYMIQPETFDSYGIANHISKAEDEIELHNKMLTQYMLPWIDYQLMNYNNDYDNKTVAMIYLKQFLNTSIENLEVGTTSGKIKRIESKLEIKQNSN